MFNPSNSELMNSQSCKSLARYDIVSMIGRGAGSCVYKIRCLKSGKYAALKVIEKKESFDKIKKRLTNEIEIHISLRHPNVISLYNHFEDDDNYYLLLELCERGDMHTHLKSKGVFSENEIRNFGRQLAEGLLYLHSNNVIHRDLKLCNILLTDDDSIKICDFGLAVKLKTQGEEHDTICGTPNYISPEIINKTPYNHKSDCWALGCILYAFATGNPPFEGKTVKETLKKVQKLDFQLPSNVSPSLKDLLQRLINPDPVARFDMKSVLQHPFFTGQCLPKEISTFSAKILAENKNFANVPDNVLTPYNKQLNAKKIDENKSKNMNGVRSSLELDHHQAQQYCFHENQENINPYTARSHASQQKPTPHQSKSSVQRRGVSVSIPQQVFNIEEDNFSSYFSTPFQKPNAGPKFEMISQIPTPVKLQNEFMGSVPNTGFGQNAMTNTHKECKDTYKNNDYFSRGGDWEEKGSKWTDNTLDLTSRSNFEATFRFPQTSFQTELDITTTTTNQSKYISMAGQPDDLVSLATAKTSGLRFTEEVNQKPHPSHNVTQKQPKEGGASILTPLSTFGINQMKLSTSNGPINIDSDGWLILEFNRQRRVMKISPNGLEIKWARLGSNRERIYRLDQLPNKYIDFYAYASKICETIRSRKTKAKLEDEDGKFVILQTRPFPTFEGKLNDGTKIKHSVSSEMMRITTPGKHVYDVNIYQDAELLEERINKIINIANKKILFLMEKDSAPKQQNRF